jgi:integrase
METNANSPEILAAQLYEMLKAEAYSKSALVNMKFILDKMSSYMSANHLKAYAPKIGEQFVAYCGANPHICASRTYLAKNITDKLNRMLLGLTGRAALLPDMSTKFELPASLMVSLMSYLDYCAAQGNKQTTIRAKYLVCGRFLKNLADLRCTEIRSATGKQVQAAFLAMKFKSYWDCIGLFMKFLFESKLTDSNYSRLIQRGRKRTLQPAVYSPEEIRRIENSLDLSTAAGVRNKAIILLMTRYGVRTCDVASLTFDNVDFENNRLRFIQQKTGALWESALIPEVKAALQNYIDNVRPRFMKCPNIFITLKPPYVPANNSVINAMARTQFQYAKIDAAERKRGSRAFRSSVASNMVNDGVPTEVVRKVLGHGTKYALKYYARIDMESMRLCPLPVPNPTGAFAAILSGKAEADSV